ncbi:hypothetical protein COHA_006487 [Chlorella ohadii]|uniref:Cytokinin riboside 5'-monophosphate phosphoribohydrolase n=1 Tax=Chlorella ohadii TaxID=2649997 RepID=A0AAD5DNM3_9CHLO|nr:hypothetical protein COHA_006487 [Chlorella ohadii]
MAAENGGLQPREFKKIAVFCGASSGGSPVYVEAARALGEEMVRRGIGLVYGGGNVGLMGAIAETVGKGLGEQSVIGVIPAALEPREISGTTVGEIRVVPSMHERKAIMFDESDAFIAIPGGYGTLDETLEITTWQQLGYHQKPVGILNINGFFDKVGWQHDKARVGAPVLLSDPSNGGWGGERPSLPAVRNV